MKDFAEKYLDLDTKGNSDLEVVQFGITELKPGESYALDRHYYHTLFFITNGRGSLQIDSHVYHLESGDMFYVPSDIQVRCTAASEETWEFSWCSFTGKRSPGFMLAFFDISQDQYYLSDVATSHYARIIESALDLPPQLVSSYLRSNSILFNLLADLTQEIFTVRMSR